MSIKPLLFLLVLLTATALGGLFLISEKSAQYETDVSAVNDLAINIADRFETLQESISDCDTYGYTFSVVNDKGNLFYKNNEKAPDSVSTAIRNGDIVADITRNGTILGKLLINRNNAEREATEKLREMIILSVTVLFSMVISIAFYIYLSVRICKPFNKLKSFAKSIAAGNLELPLIMDRGNVFGAFTESFDIMREELKKARERADAADKSKKELVAGLSHDIKTPIASIMAVSELMQLTETDPRAKEQLSMISSKAEQINLLVSNLFHAALEELEELPVKPTEENSGIISELIRETDYMKKIGAFEIPHCIIICDRQRLEQVFDNIIANSYKYADTEISVSAKLENRSLTIVFRDYGENAPSDEPSFLLGKFSRGTNSGGKSGSGLGLYLSRYFMEKMNGELELLTVEKGFAVEISLSLA